MVDILIKNVPYLITMDSSRRVIRNGAVAVDGSKIVSIGKTSDVLKEFPQVDKVIDGIDNIVMPGFINCHLHTTQQLARGLGDGVSLPSYIHGRIFPYEAALTEDDVYYSAMCACIEAIKTGTTCLVDPGGYHMEKVVDAVEKIGIRAILKRSMIDLHSGDSPVPGKMRESTKNALQAGEDFVAKYNGYLGGRIRAWFSLRTERTTSEALMREAKKLADKYGVGIGTHVSSHITSVFKHKENFGGLTPIVRFNNAGLLGPNLMIFHGNYLSPEEVDLLIENDVKVIHCPTATRGGGSGTLQGEHMNMMKRGVKVALGSDTASASNRNDMFEVMYSLTAHRDVKVDATLLPPETILEMATINGAKAALWDSEIGSLEKGKKADLIFLDMIRPDMIPVNNPLSNITMSASSECVNTVIIDGKVIMENRKIKTVADEGKVLREAQKRAIEVAKRAKLDGIISKWLK